MAPGSKEVETVGIRKKAPKDIIPSSKLFTHWPLPQGPAHCFCSLGLVRTLLRKHKTMAESNGDFLVHEVEDTVSR